MSATTSATLELNDTAPGARRRPTAVRWAVAVARFARRKPLGALGAVIVAAMLVMAAFAEQIAPYRFDETIRGARMTPPSAAHWLGTDNLSRDMWSRVVYGARVSVTVGFGTIALAIVVATAIGVSSAYFGGLWDLAVQRVVDAWLSFPYLVIILSVMAVLGPGRLLAPEQAIVLESDPARARGAAREHLSRYLQAPNYATNWLRLGFTPEDLEGGGSDRLVDAVVAWGTSDAIRDHVGQHYQAGADHVCIQVVPIHEGLPREEWRTLAALLSD